LIELILWTDLSARQFERTELGYVEVGAKISDPEQKRSKEVDFLVDTGSAYMAIPLRGTGPQAH